MSGLEAGQKHLDLIGDGEAIIDDITKVVGFFESFEDILEGTDQVENGDFGQWRWGLIKFGLFGLESETAFLLDLADAEVVGGIFKFFVFDELADQFPAWVIVIGIFFGGLFLAGQQGAALEVHQVRCHDDELGSEVNIEHAEGFDIIQVLAGDAGDRDALNIKLVFFDQIEEQIEGTLEDFQLHFIVVAFHTGVGRGWFRRRRGKFALACDESCRCNPRARRITPMDAQESQEFNERLSQWIASQGFWFQLRHSISGGGGWSIAMFHLLRIVFRVFLLLLVIALGFGIFLMKRVGSESFVEEARDGFVEATSAKNVEIIGFKRGQGGGIIRRIGAEGSAESFFRSFEAGNLTFDMSLWDGFFGSWDAGIVKAQWIDVEIKSGASSAQEATNAAEGLFVQRQGFEVQGWEVSDARISWGYSERGYGGIQGSKMTANRVGDAWRFAFEGGTFSQNWIRNFEIVELVMICRPGELLVKKGRLKVGDGFLEFRDVRVDGGQVPTFEGTLVLQNVPLKRLIPSKINELVGGSISGEFELSGSTNLPEGVSLNGMVKLGGQDSISIRNGFPLLEALDVVDVFNNYKRVDFESGEFKMETHNGELKLTGVMLNSREMVSLAGRLSVRRPLDEEVKQQLGDDGMDLPMPSGLRDDEKEKMELTLRRAAKEAKKKKGEDSDEPEGENTQFFADIGETRQLRREAMNRARKMLIFDGGFRMTIPSDAFERSRTLRERYPVDEDGRIGLDVPLQGSLAELTLRQAEEILRLNNED